MISSQFIKTLLIMELGLLAISVEGRGFFPPLPLYGAGIITPALLIYLLNIYKIKLILFINKIH